MQKKTDENKPPLRQSALRGHEVEEQALQALRELGRQCGVSFCLLKQNYRCREGEIDLILEESPSPEGREGGGGTGVARAGKRGCTLVFVEVRGRRPHQWVPAAETVTFPKRRKIERAARRFLAQTSALSSWEGLRFDVLGFDGHHWEWIQNAWIERD